MTAKGPPSSETGSITVRALLSDAELGIEVMLVAGERGLDREVKHPRIQKSGLALVGHAHGLVPARIQILGETELSFVESLSSDRQTSAAEHLFSLRPACVLVTRGADVPKALLEAAEATETPVLVCRERSSEAITAIHTLLDERLAPRTRIHGVLVDVFEVGVLLIGKSGIGKSEAALELVMRGHRLVADDVIECDYRPPGMVFGEPPLLLKYQMEVRGLGILDIKDLYGVTAIRERKRVDLIVRLEAEGGDLSLDRLGLEDRTREILGVSIREVALPVRPGRNMSAIIEIAARNELLRQAGKDSGRELADRIDAALSSRRPTESAAPRALREHRPNPGSFHPSQTAYESSVPPPVSQKGKR